MKNPPAFPVSHGMALVAGLQNAYGMTLRDYFAAKAMQGLLASGNLPKTMPDADLAECAYALADAMLKAREA
jgi:hypothetical protein